MLYLTRKPGEAIMINDAIEVTVIEIRGKSVKSIQGTRDSFHRLRVGDVRVMYDVIDEDRVILVLGIAYRGDLERWLRAR